MDEFLFTEAQSMFRLEVQRFGQKELLPGIRERAKQAYYPPELVKKIADVGLLGITIPARYGGQGADAMTLGIAMEKLGRADSDACLFVILSALMNFVLEHGTEEVRQEWLPLIAKGEKLGCLGLMEPEAGSDLAAIQATAVRNGNYYILNADKNSTTLGVQADVTAVLAKTDPKAGRKGISCFLVPLDFPGVARSRIPDLGWESVARGTISLRDVRVPVNYRIGEEGQGFYLVRSILTLAGYA